MKNRNNRLLDKLVIVDLEATCDDPRPRWHGEIIEIGVCLLDLRTLAITDKRGILVKPETTPITRFCTSLTTITPEMVAREGVSLKEAVAVLHNDYKIDERTWASWGDYDRKQLTNECNNKAIPFHGQNSPHLNLKHLMAVEYGLRSGEGMDRALERFKIKPEGVHHRGVDDAYNIARIYAKHLGRVRGV